MTSTPPNAGQEIATIDFNDPGQLGRVAASSLYFGDVQRTSQGIVKILVGRELGFGPMASIMGIYMVKGRPVLSAGLLAAAVKRSEHYDYEIVHLDEQRCELRAIRDGAALEPTVTFTFAQAERAKLVKEGGGWKNYPEDMLFARTIARLVRRQCPDLLGGIPVYTDDEGAEIAEAEASVVRQPAVYVDDLAVIEPAGVEQPDEPAANQPHADKLRALTEAHAEVDPDPNTWRLKLTAVRADPDLSFDDMAATLDGAQIAELLTWLNNELDARDEYETEMELADGIPVTEVVA